MKEYSYTDIVWIKNVKRDKGKGWAYSDIDNMESFFLNWPTSKKGSGITPKTGDIIALFQKPDYVNGVRNYKVFLTHLVSPVSEEIFEDEHFPEHKWCRKVELIAMANPINAIPNPGYLNFFKPNRGLTNPIRNLEDSKNFTEEEFQKDIWNLFNNYFCEIEDKNYSNIIPTDSCCEEGGKYIIEHRQQEISHRNSWIVKAAKQQALIKGNGRVICECCGFDFYNVYGEIGRYFIECHHKNSISQGKRLTYITDLAMVCSNCHSILHRKKEDGTYHNIESLREYLFK